MKRSGGSGAHRAVLGDKYYGRISAEYDQARCHSVRWANEQIAVSDWVFSGPVLDVPIGTGRYVGIYRQRELEVVGVDISDDMLAVARRNYRGLDARKGSVFALPFPDKHFGTVVCTRLLDWLSPEEMPKAVAELRRMANIVIVTIRHGKPECRVNYTHRLTDFYQAIDGLHIEQRRTTEITRDGTEEIFRLAPPTWADVVKQFEHHGPTPEYEIYRLGAEWAPVYGFKAPEPKAKTAKVKAEYWTDEALSVVIEKMAARHYGYATDEPPRYSCGPATILRTQGHDVVLDGRRRINQWRKEPGRYPVLLVEA